MKRKKNLSSTPNEVAVSSNNVWHPPVKDQFKLNVDASIFNGGSLFTLDMVVRDYQGHFIGGKNMTIFGTSATVMEAKARGVHEGISWIEEMGLQHVIIESDSERACSEQRHHILSGGGHILKVCKLKLKEMVDLSLHHIKKQANRAAHLMTLMTRVTCLLNSYNVFLSPPNLLLETLSSEFSSQ